MSAQLEVSVEYFYFWLTSEHVRRAWRWFLMTVLCQEGVLEMKVLDSVKIADDLIRSYWHPIGQKSELVCDRDFIRF